MHLNREPVLDEITRPLHNKVFEGQPTILQRSLTFFVSVTSQVLAVLLTLDESRPLPGAKMTLSKAHR